MPRLRLRAAPHVFVSYRARSPMATAVINDLGYRLGRDEVFEFRHHHGDQLEISKGLGRALARSDVVVALIGDGWSLRPRDERDWVRFELDRAHELGVPVLPVRLDDVPIREDSVPDGFGWLFELDAPRVREDPFDFGHDMDVIERALRRFSPSVWPGRAILGAAAITLLAVLGAAVFFIVRPDRTCGDELSTEETLSDGRFIDSPDCRHRLTMTAEGQLVATTSGDTTPWWAVPEGRVEGSVAVNQRDGNVVVYEPDESVAWATGTEDSSGAAERTLRVVVDATGVPSVELADADGRVLCRYPQREDGIPVDGPYDGPGRCHYPQPPRDEPAASDGPDEEPPSATVPTSIGAATPASTTTSIAPTTTAPRRPTG